MSFTVASWNVNSLRVRLPQVLDWLARTRPDILALQETKLADPDFPAEAFTRAGYHVAFSGQKTYNGVATVSRLPPTGPVTDLPGPEDPQRRLLAATVGNLRVLNVYVPNGQAVGSDKYTYKLDWLGRLREFVRAELEQHERLALLGDFNIAPEDRDVHDPQAWAGSILCSDAERQALRDLHALGLQDTFRLFEQEERAFSWWDYRQAAFRRNLGLRIDLLLANPELARHCTAAGIDTEPRRLPRPSDHTPVWASFAG